MRPFSPFCGTVSNALLLILPDTIRMIAPGVVTTQLSQGPPASSSATDVAGSSDRRPATAQPPLPAPTTMKSHVSICVFPSLSFRGARSANPESRKSYLEIPGLRLTAHPGMTLRHEPQHLLQPRDLSAIGRIEIGEAIEHRAVEHRLQLAQR